MVKFDTFLYDEKNGNKHLKIATTALRCDHDPGINRIQIVQTITKILEIHPDVDLVIFGEMILGHYIPYEDPDYLHKISESVPGKTTHVLSKLAQEHEIYICFGISELDGGSIYNSQVLLNPKGDIQTVHRKNNLKSGEISAKYQPGSSFVTTTEIMGIKTGIVICSDTANPSTMWTLMRNQHELIIHSLADDDQGDFVTLFQARLYDSWFVTANRYGKEGNHFWPGLITVTDPLGKIRNKKMGNENMLACELHFALPDSRLKKLIRNLWVKTPLILHILKHWKQARSYL